jgi:hypothetical protein
MLPKRHDELERKPRQGRQAHSTRALQARRSDHLKPQALLLEGLHECDGALRFGFILLFFGQAFLRLKDLKASGKGHPVQDAIGIDCN